MPTRRRRKLRYVHGLSPVRHLLKGALDFDRWSFRRDLGHGHRGRQEHPAVSVAQDEVNPWGQAQRAARGGISRGSEYDEIVGSLSRQAHYFGAQLAIDGKRQNVAAELPGAFLRQVNDVLAVIDRRRGWGD